VYLPYYSENVHKVIQPGETQKYTFYPMVSEETVTLSAEADTAAERDWLDVPKQNRQVLQEFCAQANLTKEDSVRETVQKLEQYYQDQIPYTLRPGATPYQKDFVNYFLQENKRGYCAHFASAATLIFRYLGIPARYVEGYAVDTEDIAQEGTMEYDESYEEYYQGMSLIDSKAVVSVNITDANAHAWVEVFDPDLGWQVADVTPASGEEESDNGFWQRLINFLGGSGTQEDAASSAGGRDTDNGTALSDAGKKAGEGIFLVGAFLLTIFIVKWTVNKGGYFCRYARAGYNDRLVMDYHGYLERVSRREKHLKQNNNYRRQIQWMAQHGYWDSAELGIEEAVSLMEQAGFSDRQLTEQEFFRVRSCFLKHGAISKQKAGEKSGGK
jgi:transglutaminase-like putative cysteine protease